MLSVFQGSAPRGCDPPKGSGRKHLMRRSYPAAVGDTTPRSRQIFVVKKQKVQSGSHARQQRPQLTPGGRLDRPVGVSRAGPGGTDAVAAPQTFCRRSVTTCSDSTIWTECQNPRQMMTHNNAPH